MAAAAGQGKTRARAAQQGDIAAAPLLQPVVAAQHGDLAVALELLPEPADELHALNYRAKQSSDMFAEMVGTLGFDGHNGPDNVRVYR
jgi:hypothetical protein